MFILARIIGGLIKLMGNTDGTPIGNILDAIKVNLRDDAGNAFGTSSNPIFVDTGAAGNRTSVNEYAESLSVPSGSTTTIVTYTVPIGKTASLQRVAVSGENIALFTVLVNAVVIDSRRTWFGGSLNTDFNFSATSDAGIDLVAGDVVTVQVLHNRPSTGDFEARIQVIEVN